jgi:hypothetical protein
MGEEEERETGEWEWVWSTNAISIQVYHNETHYFVQLINALTKKGVEWK